MRRLNLTLIIEACHLYFTGLRDQQVAEKLNVTPATISRWRKLSLWKETETKLIEKMVDLKASELLSGDS